MHVDVTGAPAFEVDTWVRVKGTLAGRPGRGLTVAASDVAEVAAPDNPYS